MPVYSH